MVTKDSENRSIYLSFSWVALERCTDEARRPQFQHIPFSDQIHQAKQLAWRFHSDEAVDFDSGLAAKAKQIGANLEDAHIFHSRIQYFFPCSGSVAGNDGGVAAGAGAVLELTSRPSSASPKRRGSLAYEQSPASPETKNQRSETQIRNSSMELKTSI